MKFYSPLNQLILIGYSILSINGNIRVNILRVASSNG